MDEIGIASRGDEDDAGGAKVLVLSCLTVLRRNFIPAFKIAEGAPEIDYSERRLAIVYAGHGSRITKLNETFGEVVGFE
jgi:hypothetical protein